MSKSTTFVAFAVGAAIGSVTTWQYVKNKYEQIAQDEIDSVKAVFAKRPEASSETDTVHTVAATPKEKPNISEYAAKLREHGYTSYSNTETEEEKKPMPVEKPYVISPEEFGEFGDYEKISLTLYSDGFLADDNDELVDDIDETVGFDSLNHFGEYEADSVFVRNDRLKCDCEILRDQRAYNAVINKKPHQIEE